MDYEKKYNEALERAKDYFKANQRIGELEENDMLSDIFPELKESEDERIKMEIIEYIKIGTYRKDWIAWLEKQGEHKHQYKSRPRYVGEDELLGANKQGESDETKAKMFLIDKGYPIDANGIFPTYEEMYNIIREGLENQGEQKPNPYSGTSFEYNGHTWGMCARDNGVDMLYDKHIIGHFENQGEMKILDLFKPAIEAAKEEKVDNANKVETKDYNSIDPHFGKPIDKVVPKFKVGDVMRTLQEAADNITSGLPVVVSIDDEYYRCNNESIAIKNQDDYEYPPMNRIQKPAWKPSDEQMNALDSTLQYSQVSHNSFEHLNSLFNDLKNLKS